MKKCVFDGVCTALVTPFDKSGNINFLVMRNLIEFQIACGANALLILGTTGESPTISDPERTKLIKFCVAEIAGRVPLLVGCGSNSTARAISLVREAETMGADACLVVTPYYNKCTQSGVVRHYYEIARATSLPIVAYNVPSRTGFNILPKTVAKLAKIKGVVGIKEASGNMSQIAEILSVVPKNFAVFSGDDALTLAMMSLGARGVISVVSNVEPELASLMCEYAKSGDFASARLIHERLFALSKAMFFEVNPICVKAYLNLLGFNVGAPRLPLLPPNKRLLKKLEGVFKEYEN